MTMILEQVKLCRNGMCKSNKMRILICWVVLEIIKSKLTKISRLILIILKMLIKPDLTPLQTITSSRTNRHSADRTLEPTST